VEGKLRMRKLIKAFVSTGAFCGMILVGSGAQLGAQTQPAPDNTKVNKDTASPTADRAKNTKSDTRLMADIRRDVVKDKSLSTDGHNVKIVCQNGKVTVRGPVHTEDEKKTILAYATKHAGDGNVTDEITVKGDSK